MIYYINNQKEYDNLVSSCQEHPVPSDVRLFIAQKFEELNDRNGLPRRTQSWGYSQVPLVIREQYPELTGFVNAVYTNNEIAFIRPFLKYYPPFIRNLFPKFDE